MIKEKIIKEALIKRRNELMRILLDEGFSYSDIAIMFNVAHTTVIRILNKND